MRSIVAALDWNHNLKRKYKQSKKGEQLFKSKVILIYTQKEIFQQTDLQIDRAGKKMTVVPVKEEKDMSFKDLIFDACIKSLEDDNIPKVDVSLYNITTYSFTYILKV